MLLNESTRQQGATEVGWVPTHPMDCQLPGNYSPHGVGEFLAHARGVSGRLRVALNDTFCVSFSDPPPVLQCSFSLLIENQGLVTLQLGNSANVHHHIADTRNLLLMFDLPVSQGKLCPGKRSMGNCFKISSQEEESIRLLRLCTFSFSLAPFAERDGVTATRHVAGVRLMAKGLVGLDIDCGECIAMSLSCPILVPS